MSRSDLTLNSIFLNRCHPYHDFHQLSFPLNCHVKNKQCFKFKFILQPKNSLLQILKLRAEFFFCFLLLYEYAICRIS